MLEFIIVGVGGFIGCCMRFGFVKLFAAASASVPLATLVSNIIAGFFVGFFIELGKNENWIPTRARLFLTTGMMGGLSTFSTFSMETVSLFAERRYIHAAENIVLNLALSILGVALGILAAKAVERAIR